MSQHSLDAGVVEAAAIEDDLQEQLPLSRSSERDRIVCLPEITKVTILPAATLGAQGCIQREVLEDEKALKERTPRRRVAPLLDSEQRSVLPRAHRHPLFPKFLQPRQEEGLSRQTGSDRKRVDEDTDHPVGSFDGVPTRSCGAKHDIVFAAVAA